jgi:putative ABC transport system permease protein
MLRDIRVGLRLLAANKAFTLTVGLTLAVCIGANAALFSVVHRVLLAPLPFPDSRQIVLMGNRYPGAGPVAGRGENSGAPDYYDRLRQTDVFAAQAMFNSSNVAVDENGAPTQIRVMNVTPSFFRVLRASPRAGRPFSDAEGEAGNTNKLILSDALWHALFGGDRSAIGRDVRVDGQPYTVVGIMSSDFTFLSTNVMAWRPLAFTPEQRSDSARHSNNWMNIARLEPGKTIEQAQAEIDAINARNLDLFPNLREVLINAGFHTKVIGLQDHLVSDVKATLYLMWGGALFVLLIGCVNVTNLVLVRSRARSKELATRVALGASRARVAGQLVAESLVLTIGSAAAGLFIAYAALASLGVLRFDLMPRASEIRLDAAAAAYTVGIAALIGIVLGLVPVLTVLPTNVTTALREEGRSGTASRGTHRLRRALIVAQVAFAFVLLVGAGLMFASFRHVLALDPGFKVEGVLTASVTLPRARYADDDGLRRFAEDALARIRGLPGVVVAGATDTIPFGTHHSDSVILAEGYQMRPGESLISPSQVIVTPGFFEAMKVRLVRGRFFDDGDGAGRPRAMIVDETLARHFWPGQDAIGRRLYFPADLKNLLAVTPDTTFFTVVGVIGDIKLGDPTGTIGPAGSYYRPWAQDPNRILTFAVRTASDPALTVSALRQAVAAVDRELPLFDIESMAERYDTALMSRRSPMLLSIAFGAIALLLSAVGIYGVLAYVVTLRTREIGIRIALGGSAASIFELVVSEGIVLIGLGFVLGLAGALALRTTLESQLYGVHATDTVVLASVAGLLALVAAGACVLPARRATKIDPVIALAE